MTCSQAADQVGISLKIYRRQLHLGLVPAVQVSKRRWVVPTDQLRDFIDGRWITPEVRDAETRSRAKPQAQVLADQI